MRSSYVVAGIVVARTRGGQQGGPCRSAAENYSTNLPPSSTPSATVPSSQIIRFTCFLFYDVYITPTRSSLASASASATAIPTPRLFFAFADVCFIAAEMKLSKFRQPTRTWCYHLRIFTSGGRTWNKSHTAAD